MGGKSKLSYKARRRWSLVVLLLGLPIYIIAVVTVLNLLGHPPFLIELLVYIVLGLIWIVPCKPLFMGIGQADPDLDKDQDPS